MGEFEYVMVLVSIIVGLGIAHVLLGIGGLVDRITSEPPRIRLSVAHGAWLGLVFLWTVFFWWWEYRFSELDADWTVGLYLFVVGYAIGLFLLAVLLVPRSWDHVVDVDDFFLRRRGWFYSVLFVVNAMDVADAYAKDGWEYIASLGAVSHAGWILTAAFCFVGIRSANIRVHAAGGVFFLAWQMLTAFADLPTLGF